MFSLQSSLRELYLNFLLPFYITSEKFPIFWCSQASRRSKFSEDFFDSRRSSSESFNMIQREGDTHGRDWKANQRSIGRGSKFPEQFIWRARVHVFFSLFFCEISTRSIRSISLVPRITTRRILHGWCFDVANILTRIRRLRYVSQMNRNPDAAPFAVARCSSWSRFRGIRRGCHRHFRIERVTETVLGLLHLEDLAAIAIGVAPPAAGQQLVAGWHHLVQHLSYVDTCSVLKRLSSARRMQNAFKPRVILI